MKCKALMQIGTAVKGEIITHEPGAIIEVTPEEAKRLVKLKAAEIISVSEMEQENYEDDTEYPEETLEEMSKDELVEYGAQLGLKLSIRTSKDELIATIQDFLREQE